MRILVQKFGGTSVADIDRLKMVRGKVKAALDQGYKVVVVLSAKSGKTNKLLDLSTRWAAEPDLAEVDSLLSTGEQASIALFSMLLKDSGIKARSMLGWQIPIITNDEFGRARILSIDASRIHKELEAHDVLVVAGFQGSTEDGRITTLGRGGSDTSAVALAAPDGTGVLDARPARLTEALAVLHNVDLILVEGFDQEACLPALEVWRTPETPHALPGAMAAGRHYRSALRRAASRLFPQRDRQHS